MRAVTTPTNAKKTSFEWKILEQQNESKASPSLEKTNNAKIIKLTPSSSYRNQIKIQVTANGKASNHVWVITTKYVEPNTKYAKVKASSVQLRTGPAAASRYEDKGTLKKDKIITILGDYGDWFFFKDGSNHVYAKKDKFRTEYTLAEQKTADKNLQTACFNARNDLVSGKDTATKTSTWAGMTNTQRKTTLTNFFNTVKSTLNLSNASLVFNDAPNGNSGYKAVVIGTRIEMNQKKLSDYEDVFGTIMHECRHIYQSESYKSPLKNVVSNKTLEYWEWNNTPGNYTNPASASNPGKAYYAQPIEYDAFRFEGRTRSGLGLTNYDIPHTGSWG